MYSEFAIKVNIDTDVHEEKEFEETLKKDMEKALRAVCIKHSIDFYHIYVEPTF